MAVVHCLYRVLAPLKLRLAVQYFLSEKATYCPGQVARSVRRDACGVLAASLPIRDQARHHSAEIDEVQILCRIASVADDVLQKSDSGAQAETEFFEREERDARESGYGEQVVAVDVDPYVAEKEGG